MEKQFATIVGSQAYIGRTQYFVKCTCAHTNTIYRSIWASIGWHVCKGCGQKIAYIDQKILPDETIPSS